MTATRHTVVSRRPRLQWVDNLRVLVVAGVIVVHTATGYLTGIADWYYDERTTSPVWSTLLAFPAVAGGLFGLGPLFLLAGWLSPPSLARRGPGGFAQGRLLRLGVPLLVFVLLVQPLADVVGSRPDDRPIGFADAAAATELSVMWFVAALLVFSLAYAALRRLRPARPAAGPPRLGRRLVVAAAAIGAASLLVWQLWPWNSEVLLAARLGEWPQGAVLFALGVHAAETGWLEDPPPAVVRRCGQAAATGGIATIALFALLDARGEAEPVLNEAAGWATPLFALLDGAVAVSLTVWFVVWVRGRWPTHGALVGRAARGSYAAYLVHPLVLTAVMVVLAPAPLVPEVKFALVSVAGVVACFLVGFGLTRLPGVSRVL
jgi:surface polysaccharide O-acyltransferase-like enzyme